MTRPRPQTVSERMYADLLAKYHELALRLATSPAIAAALPVEIEEPELPPDEVMAAIKQISPTRDKTYEANFAYWERNKEKAKLHPVAFAAEIIEGATFGGIT